MVVGVVVVVRWGRERGRRKFVVVVVVEGESYF